MGAGGHASYGVLRTGLSVAFFGFVYEGHGIGYAWNRSFIFSHLLVILGGLCSSSTSWLEPSVAHLKSDM